MVCSFRKGVGKGLLRRHLSQDLKEMREPRTLTAEGKPFWAGETADVEQGWRPAACRKNKRAAVTIGAGGRLRNRM